VDKLALDGIAHQVDAPCVPLGKLSASRTAATNAVAGPDPGETPGIGPFRPIDKKATCEDAAQRP